MTSSSFAARLREVAGVSPNADLRTTMAALDSKLGPRRQHQAPTSKRPIPRRATPPSAAATKTPTAPTTTPVTATAMREKTPAELLDAVRNSPTYQNWKF